MSTFRNALGVVNPHAGEYYQQQAGEALITGNTTWTPTARDTWNANFRILPRWFTNNAHGDLHFGALTFPAALASDYTEKDIWYFDLGGDYEHRFNSQNAVKLITVNRMVNWQPQQLLTQNIPPVGQQVDNSDNRAGEHVVRGLWTTKPDTQHTIEFGLEGLQLPGASTAKA